MTGPAPAFDAIAVAADIARRVGVRATQGEPMAKHTTMRVGGPADLFATAHNAFELKGLIRFARSRGIPLFLLGRGSDLVVADAGIRGLVVAVRAETTRLDGARYTAEAGVPMAKAATETQKAGLTGLEYGLAIPGTVGGAVWANAGAHGAETAAILESATLLLADGTEAVVPAADMQFRYRHSRLKDNPAEIVLAAAFTLAPADPATIAARLDDIRRWRREHQPLGLPSAGSVFRNPEGDSAGRLIDSLGLKGLRIGGAVVSEKHANFIVNDRQGTASDVRRLAETVQAEVRDRLGIELRLEIEFAGDWSGWTAQEAA
ncbi:MAG: UDP-N-acetylmuramate dehydrogenase [Chloroflexota bacterium]